MYNQIFNLQPKDVIVVAVPAADVDADLLLVQFGLKIFTSIPARIMTFFYSPAYRFTTFFVVWFLKLIINNCPSSDLSLFVRWIYSSEQ